MDKPCRDMINSQIQRRSLQTRGKERGYHLEYLGINKRITLNWIFKKLCIRAGFIGLSIGINGGLLLIR
jgi:hypothetical protein